MEIHSNSCVLEIIVRMNTSRGFLSGSLLFSTAHLLADMESREVKET